MPSADNQQGRLLGGEPSETTRQADHKPCPAGHGAEEKRVRVSDGWLFCRKCRSEQERERARRLREDPDKLVEIRKAAAKRQREYRRRNREGVARTERKRHQKHRSVRLDQMRNYYERGKLTGAFYEQRYGVPLEEAERAIAAKPKVCPICDEQKPLVFDHDSTTNRFRGWICRGCNSALGHFGDDLAGARKAVAYLEDGLKI